MSIVSAGPNQAQSFAEHLKRMRPSNSGSTVHFKAVHCFSAFPAMESLSWKRGLKYRPSNNSALLPREVLKQEVASPNLPKLEHLSGLWLMENELLSNESHSVSSPAYQVQDQFNTQHSSLYFEKLDATNTTPKQLSRFGSLFQQYGPLVKHTYWGVYIGAFAGLFAGFESGVLDPMRLCFGKPHTASTVAGSVFRNSRPSLAKWARPVEQNLVAANFLLAWMLVEALEPLRVQATVALVPSLAQVPALDASTTEEEIEEKQETRQPLLLEEKKKRKALLIPC